MIIRTAGAPFSQTQIWQLSEVGMKIESGFIVLPLMSVHHSSVTWPEVPEFGFAALEPAAKEYGALISRGGGVFGLGGRTLEFSFTFDILQDENKHTQVQAIHGAAAAGLFLHNSIPT